MLKAASYTLEGITILALLCASIIRAKTYLSWCAMRETRPAAHLSLRTAGVNWIAHAWGSHWDMPVHNDEPLHQTFTVPPVEGRRAIEIENVFGSIEVTGTDSDRVEMDVDESIRAESDQAVERDHKEVTLAVEQAPGLLKIVANYPPRCLWPGDWSFDGHPYAVETNFRLQIPRDSDLTLRTVDGREVRVRDVRGVFSVSNVFGGITMENIAGSGTARTVNGRIKVSFQENPQNDSQFASVNGSVDLYFVKNFSADLRTKTLGGTVYSDFPVLATPVSALPVQRHGTAFYLRTRSFAGGRVGAGGPVIQAESLNGEVRILEKND